MGTFPLGKKQLRFLIVAIDYFTKWVEVEPVTTIQRLKSLALYGRTSSTGLESHASKYRTIENSSKIPSFENFAKT